MARYRGREVNSSKSVKDNIKLGQVQRNRGTQLEFPYYFTDVMEFLLKIDQGTEVHRYRAQNLPEMKFFLPGTEVHSSKFVNQIQFGPGTQVQRYTARIIMLFH